MRRAAMDLLARRDHSRGELQQKLSPRVLDKPLLEAVLQQLEQENLLSDERFVESYIRYRTTRGIGPLKIQAELHIKQISEALVADYLPRDYDSWYPSLKQVWQKKYGSDEAIDYQEKMKQMKFLQGRGFYPEHIRQFFAE